MFLYIYMHLCIYASVHLCIGASVHLFISASTHLFIYLQNVSSPREARPKILVYIYTHTYAYVYTLVVIVCYMFIHILSYLHTFIIFLLYGCSVFAMFLRCFCYVLNMYWAYLVLYLPFGSAYVPTNWHSVGLAFPFEEYMSQNEFCIKCNLDCCVFENFFVPLGMGSCFGVEQLQDH